MDRKLNKIKDPGFKTPENYFEGLEDSILSQIRLENIGGSGFKLPESYFESLEDKVLDKVSATNEPKVIHLFTKRNLLFASSIAATILLLFNLSIFERGIATFETLDTTTVESYIMNEAMDSYEIASLLNNDEIIEEDFIEHNFTDENMENYIFNNIDIEDFYSE